MPSSPSIPTSPVPGKDPPLPTSVSTDEPPMSTSPNSQASPAPQIALLIPPTPSSSITNPSPTKSKYSRPSPLRQATSSSILPNALDPEVASPDPRPALTPFFTLIHDPATNTTHHPSRIHYLFADDEDNTELLSSACTRSLNNTSLEDPPASEESPQKLASSSTSSSSSATFRNPREKSTPKEQPQREERVLIVDVNEAGDGVVSASSLSANWQVLSASLSNAPTWDGADPSSGDVDEDGNTDRGLMLRIEGVGIEAGEEEGLGLGEGMGEEEMQRLLEGFDRKMGVLRKIVAAGEGMVGGILREKGKERGQEVKEEVKEEAKEEVRED